MQHVILQRQGTGPTIRTAPRPLLTPGNGSTYPGFYAELTPIKNPGFFHWEIHWRDRDKEPPDDYHWSSGCYETACPIEAREKLADEVHYLLGKTVTFDPRIEAYCPPFTEGDIEFARACYEPETDTIRTFPENYCLVHWTKGKAHIDADAATDDADQHPKAGWRICATAALGRYDSHLTMEQRNHSPEDAELRTKRWLAWLISEYRKYGIEP